MSHSRAEEMLDNAYKLVDQGQLTQAAKLFAEVLNIQEDIAEAWMMRGTIMAELGATNEAMSYLERAISLDPGYAVAHFALGRILHALGDLERARMIYKSAVESDPGFAEAWLMLGGVLGQLRAFHDAEVCSLRARELLPNSVEATTNLVNALLSQAVIHGQQGDVDSAEKFAQRVIEIHPDHADANYLLGILAAKHDKMDLAARFLSRAIQSNPVDARYHFSQGVVFWSQGRNREAIECYQKTLSLDPNHDEARWALTMAQVPIVYGTDDDPVECRKRFSRELTNLDNWFSTDEKIKRGFRFVGDHQPFYLSYREEDNRALFEQHGALCCRLMKWWQNEQNYTLDGNVSAGKVRIGIVSSQIRSSSVWHAIVKGWFVHFDRQRFEVLVFHVGSRHDETSAWARSHSSFYERGEKTFQQWAAIILRQHPDVLVYPDIGLDPMTTKLASLRLANTQIVSWGVPETTGLPTIDYYLSAEDFEPVNAQDNYTEKLILLPHLGCTYSRLRVTPGDPAMDKLGINTTRPVFICPGAPFKYAPEHDAVFAEIARRTGKCQFVFFVNTDRSGYSETLKQRLELAFSAAGVDFNQYVVFIPWQTSSNFFGLMQRANVFLDTIGFSGFNTAIQAVESGIPIVTREGTYMRGRLASGILRRMELSELITHSDEEYIALAVRSAQDVEYRQTIRKQIEEKRHVLFDDLAPTLAFQEFLANVVNGERNSNRE